MSWGVACCPAPGCGEPLVATFVRPYKEFVCVVCGNWWEFLQPIGKPETVELMARHDELRARYVAMRRASGE